MSQLSLLDCRMDFGMRYRVGYKMGMRKCDGCTKDKTTRRARCQ